MESAATVEEEKSNLKERMEAYREQMDAVKQYLSTSTYKPGSNFYRTSIQHVGKLRTVVNSAQ